MIIDRQLSALKIDESAHVAELKIKDVLLKTKDVLLKTKDCLLKTEDVLLETKRWYKCEQKIANTHPNKCMHIPNHPPTHEPTNPPTHIKTSDLDDYNKLSLWLSLKIVLWQFLHHHSM